MIVIFPLILISHKSEANPDGDRNLVSPRGEKLGDSIEIPKKYYRYIASF